MTRRDALDFLKENAIAHMRLELLADGSNKPYILALLDVVERDARHVRIPAYKYTDANGHHHYPSAGEMQVAFENIAAEFGLSVDFLTTDNRKFLRDDGSDSWIAGVWRWRWLP